MTTQYYGFGSGRFGHLEQNRAISLREGSLLQSFPPYYEFVAPGEPIAMKTVGRLIGNAVPVKLGEAIGRSLMKHVEKYSSEASRMTVESQQRREDFLANTPEPGQLVSVRRRQWL